MAAGFVLASRGDSNVLPGYASSSRLLQPRWPAMLSILPAVLVLVWCMRDDGLPSKNLVFSSL